MAKHTNRAERPRAVEPEYANVPPELRDLRQWVLWRYDWSEDSKAWAKVPYQPNGYKASTTGRTSWSTFENCLLTLEQTKSKFEGLGFVFAENDGYIGIDLDACVKAVEDRHELTPFAAKAVESCGTYAELSPSLTGLHIIGKAVDLPPVKTKFLENDIEMYSKERYFTFTGRIWHENALPIVDVNDEAQKILKFHQEKRDKNKQPALTQGAKLDTDSRLKIALKDPRIKRLFDGDISEYGSDDSRADMALCNYLAFYSDGRADILDAFFRHSKLMRVKWDSLRGNQTYGELTVGKVLAQPRSYYGTKSQKVEQVSSYDARKNYRFTFDDLWDKAMEYRGSGDAKGVATGWPYLDKFYRPTKRSLTVVTGMPSSGKSTWLDVLCYNLAIMHGWKFTFASFETQPIERHILNLCQIRLGKPTFSFIDGAASEGEMLQARKDIGAYFHFLMPPDDHMNMDDILNYVDDDIKDYEIDGFVLDPFTELDQTPTSRGQSQTLVIKDILGNLQSFTRRRDIATWLIAHPTKKNKDTFRDDRPTLSSIDGSANFHRKTDFGIIVHRDDNDKTIVYVDKVRNDVNGTKGEVEFMYDRHAKQYIQIEKYVNQSIYDQAKKRLPPVEEDRRFR